MNILVYGLGYVGATTAVVLAKKHTVWGVDPDADRVAALNAGRSPIGSAEMERLLAEASRNLCAAVSDDALLSEADMAILALRTDYDEEAGALRTALVDALVDRLKATRPTLPIVVRSTLPAAHAQFLQESYPAGPILYWPEFLRETSAMRDALAPSRVVLGADSANAEAVAWRDRFSEIVRESLETEAPIFCMGLAEAGAAKLFSNAYLATRLSFFNELATFAEANRLHTEAILQAVCADERIGDVYNQPGIGFGGDCLPKDLRQAAKDCGEASGLLLRAVVASNSARIDFVTREILCRLEASGKKGAGTVGFYRMCKELREQDALRDPLVAVMRDLREKGVDLVIYEPEEASDPVGEVRREESLARFLEEADLVVARTMTPELAPIRRKVYTPGRQA